jgi:hypothetical protein
MFDFDRLSHWWNSSAGYTTQPARNIHCNFWVVVGLQKQVFNPGTSGIYCPTVEFTTASGERVQFQSSFGTMPASHKVGQTVKVLYDPHKPDAAEIDSGLSNWFVPGCLAAFAIGAFVFSVMFLVLFFLFPNGT